MGVWSRFESFIFGAAVARASSDAVTPVLEPVKQQAWRKNRLRVLAIGTLAQLVAKGYMTLADADAEAAANGFNAARLRALAALEQTYPGIAELDDMSNRDLITPAQVEKALSRHGIPAEWHEPIVAMFSEILTPGELAAAIHRGLVPDFNPPLLRGEQPSGPRLVDSYPVYPIDTPQEAAGSGYDRKRMGVLVGLQGLPMGVIEAAQAYFRKIITHGDYIAAFNESNNRNEWAKSVLDYARQIPTARDFIENWLRGYSSPEEALAGTALHGMSEEHSRIIFENSGRAMNLHQITQALAYGAKYNPTGRDDLDPYHQATLVGPLRPEYYELNEALKYILPGGFFFRTLQQSGAMDRDTAYTWYTRMGWPPELAGQVADAFAKQHHAAEKEATAGDLLTLYDGGQATRDETLTALGDLGYPADEAQRKLELLDARRVIAARTSTASALGTDYRKGKLSADAVQAALEAMGIPAGTASTMLTMWAQYIAAEAQTQTQ